MSRRIKTGRPFSTLRHGHAREKGGHSAEYICWSTMKARCSNPKQDAYRNYGARGIQVCERWLESFEAFLADMGPKPSPAHSLDRLDVNGHYEPGNCRWATRSEQQRNRRDNHKVTVGDETLTLTEWAARLGISMQAVSQRIRRLGWSPERAVSEPSRRAS